MRAVLRSAGVAVLGVLAASGLALVLASPGTTTPIRGPSGAVVPGSISEAGMTRLGGVDQFVLIRGRDASHPLLLLLHGGPGDAQGALFRYYNSALEDHFVVVNWDQRGAGRSYSRGLDPATLTEEQLLRDAAELTTRLRTRFGDRKLVLAGHSWGTYLGIRLAQRNPADFAAYVGIGQVADQAASEALSYAHVLERAESASRSGAVAALRAVGPPDAGGNYRGGLRGLGVQRRWVREFGGAVHGRRNLGALLAFGWPLAVFREYRLRDKWNYLEAEAKSMAALEDDLLAGNLMDEVRKLELPLFVFQGRYDQQTVTSLARRYFDVIDAPHKEFIEFENSAHLVPFEEPERFLKVMVERVRPWAVR